MIDFIKANVTAHPALAELVTINEDALTKHCQEIGEVAPGVKLIKTTQVDGQNVTQVRIHYTPKTIPQTNENKSG